MKIRLVIMMVAVLAVAFSASAALETVLTSDSVVYTVDGSAESPRLQLSRRMANTVTAVLVPGTEDAETESQARLIWDAASSTLFVIWNHRSDIGDEIRLARLDSKGKWSEPITVASSAGLRRVGLQILLTRADTDGEGSPKATLIHAAWWSLPNAAPVAEYALVAYEAGDVVSTEVDTLDALAPSYLAGADTVIEDAGIALHPPMAMARTATGVDVVYGRADSTAVRRISLEARRIVSNARAWRPVGRSGDVTGRTGLVSSNGAPVQAFLSKGRIVLYTPDAQFRYMVYDDGQWSRLYMIKLDETLTSDQLIEQLHRTVDELVPREQPTH
jgi:hypothetical protein